MPRLLIVAGFTLVMGISLSAAGCAVQPSSAALPDDFGAVGDFRLTNQLNQPVSRSDLLGKVWVASFLFTRCATLCPQIAHQLEQLQDQVPQDGQVALVSFSVDPENDTPAVLKEYAAAHHANPKIWTFLTGPQDRIYRLIRESFLLAVEQNEGSARTPGNEVTHSSKLWLMDRRGHRRAYFDGRETDETGQKIDELPRLREAIAELLREKP